MEAGNTALPFYTLSDTIPQLLTAFDRITYLRAVTVGRRIGGCNNGRSNLA
jgi:hypothetical protein